MRDFVPTIGRWWVPGAPSDVVVGYLDLVPERLGPWQLTVEGQLSEPPGPTFDQHQTIFGVTSDGRFTLRRAGLALTREGQASMQRWQGWELIKGGHISDDQRFADVSFRLPHLWNWLGPGRLNYHTNERFKATPESTPDFLTVELPGGLNVALGTTFTETRGSTGESWTGFGVYVLSQEQGFTLEDSDQVILALLRLHSILAFTPMQQFEARLNLDRTPTSAPLEIIDPQPPAGSRWDDGGTRDFFFDTAEIEFGSFITAWILLHERVMAAVASAAPRDDQQFVTSKLVDVCNGLEALAVYIWDESELLSQDLIALKVLKDGNVDKDLQRYIKRSLRMRRWTLEDKLVRLAAMLGPESAAWLLGPSTKDWAHLVVRLRNSLAHGSRLPGGLSDDLQFIVTAQRSTMAVLQLALLSHAGYANPMSKHPGELLWCAGNRVAGHPNSALFWEFEAIANHSVRWTEWRRRLDR
jgi:hypothetical protein